MGTKALGWYLRAIREGKKLSRRTLAQELDVPDLSIFRIEKGEQDTGVTMIFRLAKALDANMKHIQEMLLIDDTREAEKKAQQLAMDLLAGKEENPERTKAFLALLAAVQAALERGQSPESVARLLESWPAHDE